MTASSADVIVKIAGPLAERHPRPAQLPTLAWAGLTSRHAVTALESLPRSPPAEASAVDHSRLDARATRRLTNDREIWPKRRSGRGEPLLRSLHAGGSRGSKILRGAAAELPHGRLASPGKDRARTAVTSCGVGSGWPAARRDHDSACMHASATRRPGPLLLGWVPLDARTARAADASPAEARDLGGSDSTLTKRVPPPGESLTDVVPAGRAPPR